ncbi:hypothetical protein AB0D67_38055 [Streptosporangium sp. NPDC048047]|uniref:hypothetical protein n=1 Tax=Streptosporangium sp. NPDC048047 TaxID=3155748 RepID=UPI00344604EB
MTDIRVRELTERYVALWNEPDGGLRRKMIEELWTEDGVHVLQPPQEIRETAAKLGFDHSTLRARGHDEIDVRVSRAHEEFVAPGEFVFRQGGESVRLDDVVKLTWEMAPAGGGEALGSGLEILVLDGEGRITADYQFPG